MSSEFACRACSSSSVNIVLSLGRMPLANSLLTPEQLSQPEPTYPLDLAFCSECSLVQITETVSSETLFREYLYFSSYSDTMLRHAEELTGRATKQQRLDGNSLVVEIASNDGYLLQYYARRGVPVLGIEPARNIARVAREQRGIPTISEFFGRRLAEQLVTEGRSADVVHAHNVLAHVPDLNDFLAGIALVLKEDGIAIIEVPYLGDLIGRVEFDTIYHEHLCYFSLHPLAHLFRKHGLRLVDVERIAIHGGSLRVVLRRDRGTTVGDEAGRVKSERMLAEEAGAGMNALPFYDEFRSKIEGLRAALRALVQSLKTDGKRIAAYGSSAKGSTLLNYCAIGRETIDFVVDRNPAKQGRFTPGTRLPIYAPEKLLEEKPDYVLLLTWNFADEILEQQAEYRRGGGRFIRPVPDPVVI
jgi:SAM-dependent methyltransferase